MKNSVMYNFSSSNIQINKPPNKWTNPGVLTKWLKLWNKAFILLYCINYIFRCSFWILVLKTEQADTLKHDRTTASLHSMSTYSVPSNCTVLQLGYKKENQKVGGCSLTGQDFVIFFQIIYIQLPIQKAPDVFPVGEKQLAGPTSSTKARNAGRYTTSPLYS